MLICRYFKPSSGLEPKTPCLPSKGGAGNAGERRLSRPRKAGNRTNPTPRLNRVWTSVPGLVFPWCSLALLPHLITRTAGRSKKTGRPWTLLPTVR
jgi:hypothetical protein